MRKFKFIAFVLCFISLFCAWTTPVSAASTVFDAPPLPSAYDDIKSDYPYYAFFRHPLDGDRGYVFVCSDMPIIFDGKRTIGAYGNSYNSYGSMTTYKDDDGVLHYKSTLIDKPLSDFYYTPSSKAPYGWSGGDYTFYTTNHDIKDLNGNIVFQKPLVTQDTFRDLTSLTTQGVMIVIGSTICLVALAISLGVLVRHLRASTTR